MKKEGGEGSQGRAERRGESEWGGERQEGKGGRRPSGVPVPLTVIKDIDVLRRQRVFAQVKGNPTLVMTRSTRPPSPLPAWTGDLGGLGGMGEGVFGGETP